MLRRFNKAPSQRQHRWLNNLIGALAGGRTPGGDVTVAAAPLLLQLGTVAVLVSVATGVGCNRQQETH